MCVCVCVSNIMCVYVCVCVWHKVKVKCSLSYLMSEDGSEERCSAHRRYSPGLSTCSQPSVISLTIICVCVCMCVCG